MARGPLSIVILAAGQGKRMKSDLPKVLQPLAGRPLLGHVLDTAESLAPESIIVVYGHGGERVREAMRTRAVQWCLQAEQLGTGHAVMQAIPQVPDEHTVLILYGDVPLLRKQTLLDLLGRTGPQAISVLTVRLADPYRYGRIVRGPDGNVARIVEQKDATREEQALHEGNTGVIAAPARELKRWLSALTNNNAQGEYYLTDIAAAAVRDGWAVVPCVAPNEAEVLGVNDKVQLSQVEAARRLRCSQDLMLAGATLADPARTDVRGEVEIGRDVQIDCNVILEGKVRLGNRVRIGPNCLLRDVTLGDDTIVQANCLLERSDVGAGCVIGPFARLRPGAVLADGVHVGNFVEVKNTRVGKDSKVNHLTYLGDAEIGAGVNVGAGTVTCNYDGVNKSRTTIGDGAFIGSGSMLVAPVSIGAHATIGAGSTITRDAPPDRLTLERSRQTTIEGWSRPAKKPR